MSINIIKSISQRNDLSLELIAKEMNIKRKLDWLQVGAATNKNIKIAEKGMQNKQKEPLTTKELLNVSWLFYISNYTLFTEAIHFSSDVRGNSRMRFLKNEAHHDR